MPRPLTLNVFVAPYKPIVGLIAPMGKASKSSRIS